MYWRIGLILSLYLLLPAGCRTVLIDRGEPPDGGESAGDLRGAAPRDLGPPLSPCAGLDETTCRGTAGCHPLYINLDDRNYGGPGCTRDCATVDCCIDFQRCVPDAKADCVGPALCKRVAPICVGQFVVAYRDSCYEGCVKKDECR